jgi:dTDP-glucose pyrophosphorylase
MTIMVMPMAGDGIRTSEFSNHIKPLIPILGKPMFYWAASNIIADKKVFIVRQDHIDKYRIDEIIKDFFPEAIVLIQDKKIKGQLLSTLIAFEYINTDDSIIIADCDMYSDFNTKLFDGDSDASLLVFNSQSVNYSYIKDKDNSVLEIVEKNVISDKAIAGIFYWKSGKTFLKYAIESIIYNVTINNEHYVSSSYSRGILGGINITSLLSKNTFDLSTEKGIELFTKYKKSIHKN